MRQTVELTSTVKPSMARTAMSMEVFFTSLYGRFSESRKKGELRAVGGAIIQDSVFGHITHVVTSHMGFP